MMIVQCPKCSARFRLDSNRVSDRGTRVACSNCGNQFMVRPIDDVADPFVITSVDLKPHIPTEAPAPSSAFADNPFSNDSVRTAVHKVPEVVRARTPVNIDEASTLVELPSTPTPVGHLAVTATYPAHRGNTFDASAATQELPPAGALFNDTTSVDDDDLMSIDDSDVMAMEDEPTYSPPEPNFNARPAYMAQERSPTPLPHESSRAETAIAHIPSLAAEKPPEESAVHRLHAFDRTAAPSFADAPNAPQSDLGLKTFVGRVDAATLAAASQTGEMDLRGGLSSDGT